MAEFFAAMSAWDALVNGFFLQVRAVPLTFASLFVTNIGGVLSMILLASTAVYALVLARRNRDAAEMGIAIVLTVVITKLIKAWIGRARPDIAPLVIERDESFPSLHAAAAVAYYGSLIRVAWSTKMMFGKKILTLIVCLALIVAIGISRLYLGVHWASDVVAGFFIGAFIVLLTPAMTKRSIFGSLKNKPMQHGKPTSAWAVALLGGCAAIAWALISALRLGAGLLS